MRPIPQKVKDILANEKRMKRCCLCGNPKVQWHHNLIYGSKQSDIPETILALCEKCHDQARNTEVKEKLDLIMLRQMTTEQITNISKADNYHQRLKYLENKYNSKR